LKKKTKRYKTFGVIDEYAERNKLLIDYDRRRAGGIPTRAAESVSRLRGPSAGKLFRNLAFFGFRAKYIMYRRTNGGWHIKIAVTGRTLSKSEIILTQLFLGSDKKRERLNFRRALQTGTDPYKLKRWQVLFSEKL